MKLLFICKQRETDWSANSSYSGSVGLPTKSSGLYNSVQFVANLLRKNNNFQTKIVDVVDNNSIDAEVTNFKPDVVILEAFWVVPEKFEVLKGLHPGVKWIVRMHSEVPFAATEGIIFKWIKGYLEQEVTIACNSERAMQDIRHWANSILPDTDSRELITYLPNLYPSDIPLHEDIMEYNNGATPLRVGCFGAIRPFKNILSQAIAAISVADGLNKTLEFHINGSRVECDGNSVLQNLVSLFEGHPRHKLVQHPWYEREDFLKVVSSMDLGMQVSFTETFNIVAADFASQNIPLVVSDEIRWCHRLFYADPTDINDIKRIMVRTLLLGDYNFHTLNKRGLNKHSKRAQKVWYTYFK